MRTEQYTDGMGRNPDEAAMAALDCKEQRPAWWMVAMTPIDSEESTSSSLVCACSEWEAAQTAQAAFERGLGCGGTRLLTLDGDWVLLMPIGVGGGIAAVITIERECDALNAQSTGMVGRV